MSRTLNLWLSVFHPVSAYFRKRRFAAILQHEPSLLRMKILDLGGSVHFWQKVGVDLAATDITILNVAEDGQSADLRGEAAGGAIHIYDGVTVPWPDQSFDWVISNSVIEHVPPAQRQQFASELRRVGRNYLVQTPAFAFPVEPHFVMPFLHWLPRKFARRIAGFGLWGLLKKRSKSRIDSYFDEVNLLRLTEFRGLFPDAELATERVAGIPKSHTLIHRSV
jgi:hypothetical protein